MKKIICLITAMVLCLSVVGCGNETTEQKNIKNTTSNISNEEDSKKQYVAYKSDNKTNDLLTIEEMVLTPKITEEWKMCDWKIKVRNTSGKDLPINESSMRIWYQYRDENGDKLYESYISGGYTSTIKDGEAEWIESPGRPGSWTNEDAEKVATIKIYAYSTSLSSSPEHEFSEPIIVNIKDYFEW